MYLRFFIFFLERKRKFCFSIYLRYIFVVLVLFIMATSRPTSSTANSSALMVHQLAELLHKNGHRVLHGDSKACFTSDSLTILNNYFQSAKLNLTPPSVNDISRTNLIPIIPALPPAQTLRISTKIREDLVFLYDFLQKIQVLKVCIIWKSVDL